jgi:hypothetical protein
MMWKLHLEMQEGGRYTSSSPKLWQFSVQMASENKKRSLREGLLTNSQVITVIELDVHQL